MVERRSPKPEVGGSIPFAPANKVYEFMKNPLKFIQDVKQEAFKVTWPTAKETVVILNWQERRESNPQPPVLETGALPIELHSYSVYSIILVTTPALQFFLLLE